MRHCRQRHGEDKRSAYSDSNWFLAQNYKIMSQSRRPDNQDGWQRRCRVSWPTMWKACPPRRKKETRAGRRVYRSSAYPENCLPSNRSNGLNYLNFAAHRPSLQTLRKFVALDIVHHTNEFLRAPTRIFTAFSPLCIYIYHRYAYVCTRGLERANHAGRARSKSEGCHLPACTQHVLQNIRIYRTAHCPSI